MSTYSYITIGIQATPNSDLKNKKSNLQSSFRTQLPERTRSYPNTTTNSSNYDDTPPIHFSFSIKDKTAELPNTGCLIFQDDIPLKKSEAVFCQYREDMPHKNPISLYSLENLKHYIHCQHKAKPENPSCKLEHCSFFMFEDPDTTSSAATKDISTEIHELLKKSETREPKLDDYKTELYEHLSLKSRECKFHLDRYIKTNSLEQIQYDLSIHRESNQLQDDEISFIKDSINKSFSLTKPVTFTKKQINAFQKLFLTYIAALFDQNKNIRFTIESLKMKFTNQLYQGLFMKDLDKLCKVTSDYPPEEAVQFVNNLTDIFVEEAKAFRSISQLNKLGFDTFAMTDALLKVGEDFKKSDTQMEFSDYVLYSKVSY